MCNEWDLEAPFLELEQLENKLMAIQDTLETSLEYSKQKQVVLELMTGVRKIVSLCDPEVEDDPDQNLGAVYIDVMQTAQEEMKGLIVR